MAIGLSMALAIAVLFGGFTWIYVQLDPWVRDFAGAEVAPPTPTPREQAADDQSDEETPADEAGDEPAPTEEPDEQPNEDDSANEDSGNIDPVSEDDNAGFVADYQVISLEPVRLRSGPGVNTEIVIDGLPPGTPLEFTGERQASANPDADGDVEWLQFETEDGRQGWIRQIDVGET